MEHEDIIHRCFRCGYCKFPEGYQDINCPSYRKFGFETYSPGGRMWLIRARLNKEINTSKRYGEILFSCATCGNCMEHCVMPFKDDLLSVFEAAKAELVDEGLIPPGVRDYFKAINVNVNPYKEPQHTRADWVQNTGIEMYSGQEYLFYVGDVGSFDERGKRMARAVAKVLKEADVSIGILGSEETCDGNEVKALGEKGLFQFLAEKNITQFDRLGIKKIITLDPHAFNVLRKEYPKLGGNYLVLHYSQLVAHLIRDKRLSFNELNAKITYHDPCYLGRHNHVYDEPRKILQTIPGLQFVEMTRNYENAYCCGGGGGNFFTDILGMGEDSPSRIRVREALDTGADILAVACPVCAKMFEDAVKTEEIEDRLKIMDLAEIIIEARNQ